MEKTDNEIKTLDDLLGRYPRETVERWALKGYREFVKRRAKIEDAAPATTPQLEARRINRVLKDMTTEELNAIREAALKESGGV